MSDNRYNQRGVSASKEDAAATAKRAAHKDLFKVFILESLTKWKGVANLMKRKGWYCDIAVYFM